MRCTGILEVRIWHYSSTSANVFSLVLKPPLFNMDTKLQILERCCWQNCCWWGTSWKIQI